MKDVRRDPRGLYSLIGVHPLDPPDVITAAFRRKVRVLHPDVASTGDAAAFIELKTAYDVLADPITRAEYDLSGQRVVLEEFDPHEAMPNGAQAMLHTGMRWPRVSDLPRFVWVGFGLIIVTSLAQVVIAFHPTPHAQQTAIPPKAPSGPLVVSSRTQLSPPPTMAVAAVVEAMPVRDPIPAPIQVSNHDIVLPPSQPVPAMDASPAPVRPTTATSPIVGDNHETTALHIQLPPPVPKAPPQVVSRAEYRPEPPPVEPAPSPVAALAPPPSVPVKPAPAEPAPAVSSEAQAASAAMLSRGYALLASGDVASARLMFEHAARSGLAAAAIAAGMTHDPRILARSGARGMVADSQAAATWYRRAAALGDERAGPLLAGLGSGE